MNRETLMVGSGLRAVILQSGFVSTNQAELVRPTASELTIGSVMIQKDHLNNSLNYHYNRDIDENFKMMMKDSNIVSDFNFRERVFAAGMRSFGTRSFKSWVAFQDMQPTVTASHRQFIKDTLNFIQYGEREINTYQWLTLLEADGNSRGVKVEFDKRFGGENEPQRTVPSAIPALFQRWMEQENGFSDLLFSLQIIFGNRVRTMKF